jgi:hypothetical protein
LLLRFHMRNTLLALLFFTIPAQAGEVIEIHEHLPPKVLPRPVHYNPRRVRAYSDAAVLSDAWTRAWVLLDVDATGKVTRFKFLKRPGYDLESIATREAFKVSFEPARDDRDRPMETQIVWRIEWPSHGWLADRFGITTGLPADFGFPPRSPMAYVPCAGSGPLHLGSVHPVYRDCSKPDLARADVEAWITRPAL